jgi:hypothetical protein
MDLLRFETEARTGERLDEEAEGDGFAVDQDPVAIEDDEGRRPGH